MITLLDTRPSISARYLDDKSLRESIDTLTFQLNRVKEFKERKKKPRYEETRWVYDHFSWFARCQRAYCKEFQFRFGVPHPDIHPYTDNKKHRPLKGPDGDMSFVSYVHQAKLELRWRKRRQLIWTERSKPKFMEPKVKLLTETGPRRPNESVDAYRARTRKNWSK